MREGVSVILAPASIGLCRSELTVAAASRSRITTRPLKQCAEASLLISGAQMSSGPSTISIVSPAVIRLAISRNGG